MIFTQNFFHKALNKCCMLLWPAYRKTICTAAPIKLHNILIQKILGINGGAYWPMHVTSIATSPDRIIIGVGTAPGLSPGCYIQGNGGIKLGDYTIVAPNVGLISANHDALDITKHIATPIIIGRFCWIGMNAVVLPGVVLGDHTTVGAGAIVTKSFPEGYCVLGGAPAKVIKYLDKNKVIETKNKHEYIGFFEKKTFNQRMGKIIDPDYLSKPNVLPSNL